MTNMSNLEIIYLVLTTAITTICGLAIHKVDNKLEADKVTRMKKDKLAYKAIDASLKLGIDMAKELQKEGKVNGNTAEAKEYAENTKHEFEEFIRDMAVERVN